MTRCGKLQYMIQLNSYGIFQVWVVFNGDFFNGFSWIAGLLESSMINYFSDSPDWHWLIYTAYRTLATQNSFTKIHIKKKKKKNLNHPFIIMILYLTHWVLTTVKCNSSGHLSEDYSVNIFTVDWWTSIVCKRHYNISQTDWHQLAP